MLSVLVWMLFNALFGPQQRPRNQQPPAQVAGANQPAAGDEAAAGAPPAEFPALADLPAPTSYATLGSLDPATGYRMLVTVSSVGATVHRAELSSAQYLDQDRCR